MKHLEPNSLRDAEEERHAGRPSGRLWMAVATIVCLGMGWLGTAMFDPDIQDRVTEAERRERQARMANLAPLELAVVTPARLDETLDNMELQANERQKLRALLSGDAERTQTGLTTAAAQAPALSTAVAVPLKKAPLRLVNISVWDTHAEDGDVIAIASAGYQRELVLTKVAQTLAVPVDASAVVRITGVHDGGGGITLGVRGSSQPLLMSIMSEGQTIILPVRN